MSTGIKTDAPKKPITALKSVILYVLNSNAGAMFEASSGVVRRHRRSADMTSVRIPLGSRKHTGMFTLIDESDYALVSQWVWSAGPSRSGVRPYRVHRHEDGRQEKVYLSRLLAGAERGEYVDHANGNTLDNRRSNLRICTNSQNLANRPPNRNNTSGFKGVCWDTTSRKWLAKIWKDGRSITIGYHNTAEAAARDYDRKAVEVFGEFALTNSDLGLMGGE